MSEDASSSPMRRWAPAVTAWIVAGVTAIACSGSALAEEDILSPQQAFRYTLETDSDTITVRWDIAAGYYMYRDRMRYSTDDDAVTLGEPTFSKGKVKEDEFFGTVEIYREHATVSIPYEAPPGAELALNIRSQGCADIGLCYPPETWVATVTVPGGPVPVSDAVSADPLGSLFGAGSAAGTVSDAGIAVTGGDFLPPEQAFALRTEIVDAFTVRVVFDIAEGYYLYRDKFSFSTAAAGVELQPARLPDGEAKYDEHFGDVHVFHQRAEAMVPVSRSVREPLEFMLDVGYQGCAEDGICYPPGVSSSLVLLPAIGDGGSAQIMASADAGGNGAPVSEQNLLADTIVNGNLGLVIGLFFIAGVGLAFTPCVFPMFPILSGIIVGQQQRSDDSGIAGRAFTLSITYVLAMAGAYTVAGVVTAMLGQNLQAAFQHPAVLVGFSLLFVVLALSMFGLYELQMPLAIQNRITALSNRQKGGSLPGVAAMGVLSALIVGPCVAAPLAAALIVIGQGGDPVRGGLALFSLGLGMGAPLVAYGTSAGKLLPRAGAWMERVKLFFGLSMLGVAVWMLSRVVPPAVTMALWAALGLGGGFALGGFPPFARAGASTPVSMRVLGGAVAAYGAVLVVGLGLGGTDPLSPFARHAAEQHLEFQRIASVAELEAEVARASAGGRVVMLDFYADWCTSCKEMEKHTFTDQGVQVALDDALLLQADVTANNADDKALLAYFGIYGPPTIAFFGPDGTELKTSRVVGFMPAERFEQHVQAVVDATAGARVSAATVMPE
jgi:thiol:disulfide interchange protein DsbD